MRLIGVNGKAPEPMDRYADRFDVDLRRALAAEGNRLTSAGRFDEALRGYELSGQVAERIGDRIGVQQAALGIGMAHGRRGDYPRSAEALQRALAIAEELHDQSSIASALGNLGIVRKLQGEYDEALQYYERALALAQTIGETDTVARVLNNIGGVHQLRGSYATALDYFQRSARLKEELGLLGDLDVTLSNIGTTYLRMGDPELAFEQYARALKLAEERHAATVPAVLHHLARLNMEQHRLPIALDYYARALAAAETAGNKDVTVAVLADVGIARRELGDLDGAMRDLERGLALSESINDRQGTADVLVDIAETFRLRGAAADAVAPARRASKLAADLASRETFWHARNEEAMLHAALGHMDAAVDAYRDAIDVVEQIRADSAAGATERPAFLASRLVPFQRLAALLVAGRRPAEALAIAERAKARVLLDVLSGARADARLLTIDERERERQLERAASAAHAKLRAEQAKDAADAGALESLRRAWGDARLAQADFQATLYGSHDALRLSRGDAAPGTFDDAAAIVDAKTAIVEFMVTSDVTLLFVVSRGAEGAPRLDAFTIPIGEDAVNREVERYRKQLADRDLDFQKTARDLYARFLGPADAALRGKTSLVIVPDAALWSLPFQALQSGPHHFLIEDTAIALAPSLAVIREIRGRTRLSGPAKPPTLVAFGDPETADSERTPVTAAQVGRLRDVYGPKRSRVFVGKEATEARFLSDAANANVLHLATHGVVDAASPMYSFLQLTPGDGRDRGPEGRLEAWEIMQTRVHADVTVLAACDTGRGGITGGEGIIGLSWAFFLAGSPRTVVSLWKVDAQSTTDLMIALHRRLRAAMMLRPGKPDAAAGLRAASLSLLRDPRYRHPFYWAGFFVVGDGS